MNGRNLKKYKEKTHKETDVGNRKYSKTVIIGFICCILAGVLYIGLPRLTSDIGEREETEEKYYFEPIILNENIYADKEYMQLDRNYYFEDSSYGTTVSFDPGTLDEVPETYKLPVSCLVKYLDCAKDGDTEGIYKLYSDQFFKNGYSAKTDFTAQKIYEIKFSIYDTSTVSEPDGSWDSWYFWVEYKIFKNNGTFRNDMGSDCSRKELFQLTYRDGIVEIDAVVPYRTSSD